MKITISGSELVNKIENIERFVNSLKRDSHMNERKAFRTFVSLNNGEFAEFEKLFLRFPVEIEIFSVDDDGRTIVEISSFLPICGEVEEEINKIID